MTRELRQPHAALADLCDGFFDDLSFLDECARVAPEALPEPHRRLLVHREHMTGRLSEHFGERLRLAVLAVQHDAGRYARKILLSLAESGRVAEFGIVRMELRFIPPLVQQEITQRGSPLGAILERHNVLRRISPRWYFRFPPRTPVAAAFGADAGPAIGRVGTIYCDEEPAIDLLEVVAPREEGA